MGIIGQAFSFPSYLTQLCEDGVGVDNLWINLSEIDGIYTQNLRNCLIHKLYTLIHAFLYTNVDKCRLIMQDNGRIHTTALLTATLPAWLIW